jgi:nitrogen fixation protein FixH
MTRTAWRFFPHAMVGTIALMVIIDSGLAWTALRSFPGLAADDVFDHSNSYNDVLARAAREAALGWTAAATVQSATPVLRITDRAGQPVHGADVRAVALRPLGSDHRTRLAFHEQPDGRYLAAGALDLPGQWELRISVAAPAGSLHATTRVIVK